MVDTSGFFAYDAITTQCQELFMKIYDIFNGNWVGRVDYILSGKELKVLEINTISGMSRGNLFPKMLRGQMLTFRIF